jgi:hypothetical protein
MRVAIIVLLLSTSVVAQMRGTRGGFRGGFPHHGGVIHRPGVFHHGAGPLIPQAGRPFFPGVPASVTSLGPCGFTPCFQPFFKHGFRRFGASPFFGGGFVGAYPVAVPIATYADYATVTQPPVVQQPALPQSLEITIVDRRGEKQNEAEPAEPERVNPSRNDDPDRPSPPAIFIFKDGSRKELANYAIMRGQLIDVTDGKLFRIPLETLDREKTLMANAKAGRAIQLP